MPQPFLAQVSQRSAWAPPPSASASSSANFLSGALRNPSAADGQFARAFIGAALAEGLGIFAFVVALILLFVVK